VVLTSQETIGSPSLVTGLETFCFTSLSLAVSRSAKASRHLSLPVAISRCET
ncbi:hypothetical protein A2U01_0054655, partial [Trifolium medium]|nr:hypothetical protein [Trifolium medium]